MLNRRVGRRPTLCVRSTVAAAFVGAALTTASPLYAQTTFSVGGGLQTSFAHTGPEEGDSGDEFLINSARLYLSGPVTQQIKFMFNTEYNGVTSNVSVIDAVARLEFSPQFNIWMGRFLPPSDRANLYGPYYSSHWGVYSDGVQDGYPFAHVGRNNGVMYWGQFGKVKLSAGAFDGFSTNRNPDVLGAARVQVNFWEAEDGYYLNGSYYGAKNLLTVGGAVQGQSGNTAASVDLLLERKVGEGGAFTIESEYARYDALGGYNPSYALSEGGYVLAAYLFPQPVGVGRFQLLGKFARATFEEGLTATNLDHDQKTTEVNLNYVIKEFNARLMVFFKDTRFNRVRPNSKQFGVGLQIQL
jgi:hypothetical protein